MLVVMPNGRAMKDDRPVGNVFGPEKVAAFANFEKDLLTDLIPYIEKKYPVLKEPREPGHGRVVDGRGAVVEFRAGQPR